MSSTSFVLPDLLSLCPFPARANPHFERASKESYEWLSGFGVFKDRKRAFFIQGENELLCSYAYPYADYEQLRGCSDFVNLLFVLDETSDVQDGQNALKTGLTVYNAFSDPDFEDGSVICTMTKQ